MTGEQLLAEVTSALDADYPGLRWYHSYDARRDKLAGWPDLAVAGPGGFIVAECKGPDEELRPDQVSWKWAFLGAGIRWRLWRPANWESGNIRAELDRLSARW